MTSPTLDDLPGRTPTHDERPEGMHAGCDCGGEPEAPDPWRKGFTRRRVVGGTAAMVAALGVQTVTSKWAFSATKKLDADCVLVINLRGGWDSLNAVVPTFEKRYYDQRPNIRVPEGQALPLARGFGLHPSLKGLHAMYRAGTFAPVVACGTPDTTLSHFEAMDTLDRGTARGYSGSGWMNRVLEARRDNGVFSGVAFGSQLPLVLSGDAPALALDGVQSFGLAGYDDVRAAAATAFSRLYRGVAHPMSAEVTDTLRAIGTVQKLNAKPYKPAAGAAYPQNSGLANTLRDAARLIKAGLGMSLGTIDVGGWDMHTNEGGVGGGDFTNHMNELDGALTAFARDLGPKLKDVTVVLVSEFGRTLRENGTNGTDHGHGQCMWVLGGGVKGGKVYGAWPGLDDKALYNNGSLAGRTDYRDVLGEVLLRRAGVGSLRKVFPDHTPKLLGMVTARR